MSSTPVAIWSPAGRLDPFMNPDEARLTDVNLQGDSASIPLVYPPGLILGEVTAVRGLFGIYNSTLSDGTQTARMINQYLCSVTGAGGAVGAISSFGGEWPGLTWSAVPAYMAGTFDLARIINLDATNIAQMYGRIVEGALGVNEVDSIAQTGGTGTWVMTLPIQTIGGYAYPAVSITGISATVTAANLVIAVNAALAAAAVPAYVTGTGGALGTNPIILTYHGAFSGLGFVATVDNTGMSGGTVAVTRSTPGVAPYGIVRFG